MRSAIGKVGNTNVTDGETGHSSQFILLNINRRPGSDEGIFEYMYIPCKEHIYSYSPLTPSSNTFGLSNKNMVTFWRRDAGI